MVASFIAIDSFFVCMIVFACKRCTSLEDRRDFLEGAEEIVSSALLFVPLAPLLSTKRLGVAATLGVAFVALVLLLLLVVKLHYPVSSA